LYNKVGSTTEEIHKEYYMRNLIILIAAGLTCITWKPQPVEADKPHIAFSFDDGNPRDILTYKGSDWNHMIVEHLKRNHINAAWFVAGKGVDNAKGKTLLYKWNEAGNVLANHTYSHLNYNNSQITCTRFVNDIFHCDSLLSGYTNYKKIFRYPYLKTGNTIAKRDSLRAFLQDQCYRQGWVTIDASDWYVNSRLIERLKADSRADITGFREFYINHILERARYYNTLSIELNHRQIRHVVLLHFNLTSALFLGDLIDRLKKEGWEIDNYTDAMKDPVYNELPEAMPSEQSLIWLMAKQSGKYEDVLRYPGEDGDYEKEKMDKLGL
jgi:peptidoglycan-N-acetylglucosamine deacetylase